MLETLTAGRGLIAERGVSFDVEAFVVALLWASGRLVVAGGDGSVRFGGGPGIAWAPAVSVRAHEGAVLCAAVHPDGVSVLTGGDDGRLVRSWPTGASETVQHCAGRWIENVVASAESGVVVFASGKEACVLAADGSVSRRLAHPSTIGGLALEPRGQRLAASHYGGATLWWTLLPDAPKLDLPWRGSHLAVAFSPDRRFLVTGMQENALHGWRIDDKASMHMSGYPAKTRSLSWAQKGRWLATSGADRVVCWPFTGKNGPMQKQPQELGPAGLLATRVACHPADDVIAAGYEDGSTLLLRLADDKSVVVTAADGSAVSALAWSPDGTGVAVGGEGGRVGILPIAPGARK